MVNKNSGFIELSKAKIQKSRNVVISKNTDESGYTMAQQLVVEEGNKKINIFMKGAIIIDSVEGLYELRDAINIAIQKEEKE